MRKGMFCCIGAVISLMLSANLALAEAPAEETMETFEEADGAVVMQLPETREAVIETQAIFETFETFECPEAAEEEAGSEASDMTDAHDVYAVMEDVLPASYDMPEPMQGEVFDWQLTVEGAAFCGGTWEAMANSGLTVVWQDAPGAQMYVIQLSSPVLSSTLPQQTSVSRWAMDTDQLEAGTYTLTIIALQDGTELSRTGLVLCLRADLQDAENTQMDRSVESELCEMEARLAEEPDSVPELDDQRFLPEEELPLQLEEDMMAETAPMAWSFEAVFGAVQGLKEPEEADDPQELATATDLSCETEEADVSEELAAQTDLDCETKEADVSEELAAQTDLGCETEEADDPQELATATDLDGEDACEQQELATATDLDGDDVTETVSATKTAKKSKSGTASKSTKSASKPSSKSSSSKSSSGKGAAKSASSSSASSDGEEETHLALWYDEAGQPWLVYGETMLEMDVSEGNASMEVSDTTLVLMAEETESLFALPLETLTGLQALGIQTIQVVWDSEDTTLVLCDLEKTLGAVSIELPSPILYLGRATILVAVDGMVYQLTEDTLAATEIAWEDLLKLFEDEQTLEALDGEEVLLTVTLVI